MNTWLTDQLYFMSLVKTARDPQNYPSTPPYCDMCFLTIQNDIDRTFIKATSQKVPPVTVLHRFPYPSVSEDTFISVAGSIFPLLFVICLILTSKNIIKVSHNKRLRAYVYIH